MQRLGSPWALRRLVSTRTRAQLRHGQVRYEHSNKWPKVTRVPMRNRFPTFQASTLILDLDAEDNEHVRPFNQEDDGELEEWHAKKRRDMEPMTARIAQFEAESKTYEANFANVKIDMFSQWRISDVDLFSATLLDLPSDAKYSDPKSPPETINGLGHDQIITGILDWNGIQHRARDSTSKTIPYMMRCQQVVRRRKGPESNSTGYFLRVLKGCQSLLGLERIISPIIQSPPGLAFVAENTDSIARHCLSLWNRGYAPATAVLSFMNDLAINLKSHGLLLSAAFEKVGLNLSLECDNLEAARRYIGVCRKDTSQLGEKHVLIRVLKTVIKSLDGWQQDGVESSLSTDIFHRVLEAYGLLTGYDPGKGIAQLSVRNLYSRDYQTHLLYITSMARLGAFRTMWHEWHHCLDNVSKEAVSEPSRVDGVDSTTEGTEHESGLETGGTPKEWLQELGLSRADAVITMSRLYAEAILRLLGIGQKTEELLSCVDFIKPSNGTQRDCGLEMEAIFRLEEIRSKAGATSKAPRILFKADEFEKTIKDIFSHEDITKSLAGLQGLLSQAIAGREGRG